MKRHDYHIHPTAFREQGPVETFIQQAVSEELEEICITDHMPLSISDASDRIPKGGVGRYCRRVRELAEQYKRQITIKTGIEVDYHPMFQKEIEQVLKEGNFDYVIGSSHLHIPGYGVDFTVLNGDDFATMTLNNILLSVKSGYFDAVAHMDMYLWVFDQPERFPLKNAAYDYELHREQIAEILEEIRCRKMYLELNTHRMGMTKRIEDVWPDSETIKMALAKDLRFRFGSDAHTAEMVGFGRKELENHPLCHQCMEKEEY